MTIVVIAGSFILWLVISAILNRRLLLRQAKQLLSPDLLEIHEILSAALQGGMLQRKDKIKFVLEYLDELIVRD